MTLAIGDAIRVLPSDLAATVTRIEAGGRDVNEARAGESVIVHLDRDLDASRGLIVRAPDPLPQISGDLEADLVWLADRSARVKGAAYRLKHCARPVRATVDEVDFRLDMATLERLAAPNELGPNDVARVHVTAKPSIAWDPYSVSRVTGSFVLIAESSGDTHAALTAAGTIKHGTMVSIELTPETLLPAQSMLEVWWLPDRPRKPRLFEGEPATDGSEALAPLYGVWLPWGRGGFCDSVFRRRSRLGRSLERSRLASGE